MRAMRAAAETGLPESDCARLGVREYWYGDVQRVDCSNELHADTPLLVRTLCLDLRPVKCTVKRSS